jgi:hypothetical protein
MPGDITEMVPLQDPSIIDVSGVGEGLTNTVQNKDGINLLIDGLLAGTLFLEIYAHDGFRRYENLTWDLASLPGKGLAVNTDGSAVVFVQIARGLRYRLAYDSVADLTCLVSDTGNT